MRLAGVLVVLAAGSVDAGTIVGRVTEPGRPLANATVVIGGRTVRTDNDGTYRVEDVAPGDYTVVVYIGDRSKIVRVHVGDGTSFADAELLPPPASDPIKPAKVASENRYFTDIPLPGRTYEVVMAAAPGAVDDGFGVAFSGSTSLENRYVINGVDVTELAYGSVGTSVPNPFIESVNVSTGGAGPAWGRSTGGIVEVETHQGTNEVHGGVFGYFSAGALSAAAKTVAVAPPTIDASSNVGYDTMFGAEIGGPIAKDHLWFYAGFAPSLARTDYTRTVRSQTDCRKLLPNGTLSTCESQYADGTPDVDPKTGFPITDIVDSQVRHAPASTYNMIGRVDLAINPEHQGNVTLFVAPSSSTSPALVGVETADSKTTGSITDLSARWSSKLDDVTIKATLGWHHSISDTGAQYAEYAHTPAYSVMQTSFAGLAHYGGESAGALKACTDGGPDDRYPQITNCPADFYYATGGPGAITHELQDRVTERISIGDHVGAHHLEAGLDADAETRQSASLLSGGYQATGDLVAEVVDVTQNIRLAPIGSTDPRFDKTCLTPGDGTFLSIACQVLDDTVGDPGTIRREQRFDWAGYAGDTWQPRPDVTIELGLRYEQQRLRYPDDLQNTTSPLTGTKFGTDVLSLTGNYAPRVGVVYDPTGEGRAKIFAHWGRYFEAVPLQVSDSASGGTTTNFSECSCLGVPNCKTPTEVFNQIVGGTGTVVDPSIRAEYLDELVAGGQLEIVPDLVVGATIKDRRLGRVIEDVSTDGLQTYLLANPGEGLASSLDKPTRDYDAIELTVSRRFSRLFLLASYTYSRTFGDYAGDIDYNTGQAAPNTTSEYDIPALVANRRGLLPQDRPHNLKIDGSYVQPIDPRSAVVVGARIRLLSGTPEYALAGEYTYGSNESYLLPPGVFGRTPLERDLDLHIAYRRRFAGVTAEVFADALNLFDSQVAQSVDNSYTALFINANPIVGGRYQDLIWAKQTDLTGAETDRPVQRNVNFHQPTTFYAPLSGQLGFRMTF